MTEHRNDTGDQLTREADPAPLAEDAQLETASGWFPAWFAAGLGLLVVLGATALQAMLPPLRGREGADPATVTATAVVDLVAQLSMLVTFGLLLAGVWFSPVTRRNRLSERGRRLVRLSGRTAAVWLAACVLLVPLTAGENNAVSILVALQALVPFLSATQSAAAWMVPMVLAAVLTLTARRMRTVGAPAMVLGLALVWQLAPVLTGNVSVGANHDLASDAAIWATVAQSVLVAGMIAFLLTPGADTDPALRRRIWILELGAVLVVLAAQAVVAWYEIDGSPLLMSSFGVLRAASLVLWGFLGVRLLLRQVMLRITPQREGDVNPALQRFRLGIGVDLSLAVLAIAMQVGLAHMAPPRFYLTQSSAQINYLGYTVDQPPSVAAMLLPGRPNLLLVSVAVLVMVAYAIGFVVLRRRGVAWPATRLAAWLIGWSVVLLVTGGGIWAYSAVTFSKHMLVHMSVNMLAPVLIVLGAPITMALRLLPSHGEHEPAGLREVLTGVLAWKPLEVLLHPVLVGLNFVGAFYVVYFSDLFAYLMRYHWGHQLMTVHFLISGLIFFGLVAGPDRMPRELPHIARLGFLFAVMPFHAFFAVALLQSDGIIAENYYRALSVPWMHDLLADQRTGGQFTWALGELPMLVVVIALLIQWFQQDSRDARRQDRAMDEGLDDSHEAYNEMLRKLAERTDGPQGSRAGSDRGETEEPGDRAEGDRATGRGERIDEHH